LTRLDPWLYRYPFEGRSAARYALSERPGFGDLDQRLLETMKADLNGARRVLDVGSGPATFTGVLARTYPHLQVIALEPSAAYMHQSPVPTGGARRTFGRVRGRAEQLPLCDGSFDVAVCVSSIRHVRDRERAFCELRRVVAQAGVAYIIELDPEAGATRIRQHARGIQSVLLRLAFGPLVVRTAPTWRAIAELARAAGWGRVEYHADPEQPVYILRLDQRS
jgi:ubiquinone/menaquinone biosynthesis C-methylase UbiE